jgi:transcriptional regulator with XRE-family HTH domain
MSKQHTFGRKLLHLRARVGVSREVVAVRVGISNSSLTRYENDKVLPGLFTARAIADYYGVTLDWLTEVK